MKYSKQRDYILGTVQGCTNHPTAYEVYEMVRQGMPNISLGTVYRNLGQLVDGGKLLQVKLSNMSDRFDGTLHMHEHFVCDKCGEVQDIDLRGIDRAQLMRACSSRVFAVTGIDMLFHGLCNKCIITNNN